MRKSVDGIKPSPQSKPKRKPGRGTGRLIASKSIPLKKQIRQNQPKPGKPSDRAKPLSQPKPKLAWQTLLTLIFLSSFPVLSLGLALSWTWAKTAKLLSLVTVGIGGVYFGAHYLAYGLALAKPRGMNIIQRGKRRFEAHLKEARKRGRRVKRKVIKLPSLSIIKSTKRLLRPAVLALLVMGVIMAGAFFFRPDNSPISIKIPKWYHDPLIVKAESNELNLVPVGAANVKVERVDGQYIYRNVYPHTDVIQSKTAVKLKEELLFHQPGHPTVFKYRIENAAEYHIEKDKDGNLVFYDKELYDREDQPAILSRAFTIPWGYLEDAQKRRSAKAVKTELKGDTLTITVDKSWLSSAQYPVTLDPTIEINILNVHSHPQQGENWEVSFTTVGQADLKIIPTDSATIIDDEFVSLTCLPAGASAEEGGDEQRDPEILDRDVIYYKNWHCDGVGKIVHYTKTAGRHTLKFEFADQTAYAYNNPGGPVIESVTNSNEDSNSTTFDMTMPATRPDGDLYIAVVGKDGTGAITAPGGWNEIYALQCDSGSCYHGAWWKIGSNEQATTTFTAATDQWSGAILRITNFDRNNPINATSTNTGDSTTPTASGVTPTASSSLILYTATIDTRAWATDYEPATTSKVFYQESTPGGGANTGNTAAASKAGVKGTSTGSGVFTISGGTADEWAAGTVAIAAPPATISSNNDQEFEVDQATTTIEAITITANHAGAILDSTDIRITIATTSVDMRWNTTDLLATITGTASSSASSTVSYSSDGSVLIIDVTTDFAADEYITIFDLSFVNFNDTNAPYNALQLYLGGDTSGNPDDTDDKTVTIYGKLAAGDHTMGQQTNRWAGQSSTSTIHYRFKLTPTGETMNVGTTTIDLSGISGISANDITSARLYYDSNRDGATSTWTQAFDGSQETIRSFVFDSANNVIYAGQGREGGDGDVYRCQPNTTDGGGDADGICEDGEWTLAFDGSANRISALTFDSANNVVYAGQSVTSSVLGDVYRCQPNTTDGGGDADGICEDGEWTLAFDGSQDYIESLTFDSYNNVIYAGQGDGGSAGYADVYRCQPNTTDGGGDADGICETGEWTIAYDGTLISTMSLAFDSANNVVYAGQRGTAGDGDVYRCQPNTTDGGGDADGLCEDGEWTQAFNGSQESIESLTFDSDNNVIYAGQGNQGGDGDIYRCQPNTTDGGGDADGLCEDGEWTQAYDGTTSGLRSLAFDSLTKVIYAGEGMTNSQLGDVYRCQPGAAGDGDGICETTEWTLSFDGSEPHLYSLGFDSLNAVIYAGQGSTTDSSAAGDIFRLADPPAGGYEGQVSISGDTGTITFATSTTYTISTSTDFLVELTVNSLVSCDKMTMDFSDASTTGAVSAAAITLSGDPSGVTHVESSGSLPTITSVVPQPSSLTPPESTVTFRVGWNGTCDAGGNVKVKICQTDSLTGQNCDGGDWASSTAFTASDPATVSTTTKEADKGWNDYWAFVCDDENNCSGSYYGRFYIGYSTQLNSPITDYLTSGLVGHWTFNGEDMDWASTTAEVIDRSGQGNHGDMVNMQGFNSVAIGKVGQGMEFRGGLPELEFISATSSNSTSTIVITIAIDDTYMYAVGYENVGSSNWRIEKRSLSDGSLSWLISSDPGTEDIAMSLAIDDTYMYAVGYENVGSDIHWRIEKRALSDGALSWPLSPDPGGGSAIARDIAIDDTYMYVVGTASTSLDQDWRIEKRALSDGTLSWATSSDPGVYDTANAIAIDDTYMYVAGYETISGINWRIEKRALSDGTLSWATSSDPGVNDIAYDIAIDDTYMYVVGTKNYGGSTNDWYFEKRDIEDGSLIWATSFDPGSPGLNDQAKGIAIDGLYMYVVGYERLNDWRIEKRLLSNGLLVNTITTSPSENDDRLETIVIDGTYMYLGGFSDFDMYFEKRNLYGGQEVYISDVGPGAQTLSFWMKAASTTNYVIDLNNIANIDISNWDIRANNFTSPTIYIDGIVASTTDSDWHFVAITTDTGINATNTSIGKIGSSYFNGILDEVRVYNRALTSSEVERLYRYGTRTLQTNTPITKMYTSGLVGSWTFNGPDMGTSSAQDTSGNNNTGWLINGPKKIIGKVGQGLEFSGRKIFTCGETVQDIEDNSYGTVLIGTQCWMTENMFTTLYPDGSPITKGDVGHGSTTWAVDQGWYSCPPNAGNDGEDCPAAASLGMLYQWGAAMASSTTPADDPPAEGDQGICPTGWHVPTDAEQHTLDDYLDETTCNGGRNPGFDCDPAGSKLAGNDAADENWTAGTLTGDAGFDSSGFNAPPSGYRLTNGLYSNRANRTYLWSSSEAGADAWFRYLLYSNVGVYRYSNPKAYGFIVRCLNDSGGVPGGYIDLGNVGSGVQTLSFWMKADSVSSEHTYVVDDNDAQAYRGDAGDGLFNDDGGEFTAGDYANIDGDDSNYVQDDGSAIGEYQYHRFIFTISESVDSISQIDITWKGENGGSFSFSASTRVKTSTGDLTFLELYKADQEQEDLPLIYYLQDDKVHQGHIERVIQHSYTGELITFYFSNGQEMKVTPHHLILVDGEKEEYIEADKINIGARLPSIENKDVVVIDKSAMCFDGFVYDLTVKEYHNFLLTAGLFVHNTLPDVSYGHSLWVKELGSWTKKDSGTQSSKETLTIQYTSDFSDIINSGQIEVGAQSDYSTGNPPESVVNSYYAEVKVTYGTNEIIDLDGGTHTASSTGGTITANGFVSPTVYVDGVVGSTITTDWHHVVFTTGTGINVNDMDIGRVGGNYYEGILDEVRIYNRALSADEIQALYRAGDRAMRIKN